MKKVLKAITLFILLGANLLANQPEWFLNISKPNTIIGYGQSKNRREAISFAREEIINTLSVNVESKISATTVVDSNGYKKHFKSYGKSSSKLTINDSVILKSVNSDGIWYVAVGYNTLPTVDKLSALIKNGVPVKPSYLNFTKFGQQLKKILNYNVKLDIFRKDNGWYIQANNDISSTVRLTDDDFLDLFAEKNYKAIEVPSILHDGECFNIKLKSNSKYKTLLSVEKDGKVGLLTANNLNNYFPSKNQYMVMNNSENKTIYEMIVLIESNVKIDVHQFENVHETVLDNSNYKFAKLVYFLNKYNYSSKIVKVRKK